MNTLRVLAGVAGVMLAASVQAQAPAAETHSASVHTRTVTHHDGRKNPQVRKVVHRSTVQTPTGTAVRTDTTTSTTPTK